MMARKRTRTSLAVSLFLSSTFVSPSALANDDEGFSCHTFTLMAYQAAKLRDSPSVSSVADARVYVRKIIRNSDKSEENKKYDRLLLNKAVDIAFNNIVDDPHDVAQKGHDWCVETFQ